ncbi:MULTISPECIES: hypothetical protein [unclassified Mycobacterium]|uniref:hypothetical protein n=1 Tax=unclassified Mycobacterium TaxID=2642494 RepID=UPI002741D99E|nr:MULTISPECIES: hypothetical protein [unclassified Mycobacterium]MDP7704316.1 hypothetical protein [Mycobacterium sp. TY815]MDP7722787.1 hypothetical protein [Mycobacterium sp. TY814]
MYLARPAKALAILCSATVLVAGCHSKPPTSSSDAPPGAGSAPHNTPVPAGVLFSTAVPWNVDVSGAAKSGRSDAIIHALSAAGGWGTGGLQADFSIPVFFADGNARRMQVVGTDEYCYDGPDCDSVPAEMPVPANAYFEGSSSLTCDTSGATQGQEDCHLLVVDRGRHTLYEIYHGGRSGEDLTAQGFFTWDLTRDYPDTLRGDQCTSADAAGFPIAAMTPTADEVASGAINHAIRFILPNDRMKAGVYVRPATHAGGPASTDPNAPPYGVRFRLRAGFDESHFSASERVVIAALKKYGMLLADGGQVPLTFADDRTSSKKWSELGITAQSFNNIGVEEFEVVNLGADVPLTYDCIRNE